MPFKTRGTGFQPKDAQAHDMGTPRKASSAGRGKAPELNEPDEVRSQRYAGGEEHTGLHYSEMNKSGLKKSGPKKIRTSF